jgi:hypothetical protein
MGINANAFGQLRGGFKGKVYACCDNEGFPIGSILTGCEASDTRLLMILCLCAP